MNLHPIHFCNFTLNLTRNIVLRVL